MSRFKNAQEIHAENGTRDMRLENMKIEELFKAHMDEAHPEKQMPEPRHLSEKQECFTYDDMRHAFARGWHASKHVSGEGMRAAMQSSASSSCAATVPEGCTPTDAKVLREGNFQLATENQRLREALRFYANRQHWTCEGAARLEWDTVSGEPQNWHWRENATDDAEGIEDGEIARSALRGENVDWDGDSPPVIEGEPEWHIEQAAKASAVPESETINATTPAPAVEERSCESASGMTTGQGLASAAPQSASAPSDAEDLLDWIASEYIKVDPFDMPTGQGDADVGWRFSQYHQSKPHERVIYEHFVDDLPAAIRAARSAISETKPDGHIVILDDKNSPHGSWYVGAYHTDEAARAVAEKGKQGARVEQFVILKRP